MHVPRWGGRRAGAGRPAKGPRPSERHQQRPALVARVVHVTARVDDPIARALRRLGAAPTPFARALALSRAREDFRIVHLGVRVGAQGSQLELIVEARDRLALARGMQGFQVSAARSLNRVARRTGRVFTDRYHARVLVSGPARARAVASLPPNAWQLATFEAA
jgi:putative transposase